MVWVHSRHDDAIFEGQGGPADAAPRSDLCDARPDGQSIPVRRSTSITQFSGHHRASQPLADPSKV